MEEQYKNKQTEFNTLMNGHKPLEINFAYDIKDDKAMVGGFANLNGQTVMIIGQMG